VYKTLKKLTPLDPWFEIYEISDETYAIYEPFHFEEAISFVIQGDKRAILLDTGMGVGDIRAEAENLTSLPLAVVNTHWHYDHIGGNYQFKEVWAFDLDFEVGKIERGMTVEEVSDKMRPEMVCAPFPKGFDPSTYEVQRSRVTRRLRHLEEIDLGNRTLVVHHTPGHSPGGLCLFDERDGILFSGDTYYPGTMYCNLERSNLDDFVKSLKYLADLASKTSFVATSHNEAKVPPQEIVDALEGFLKIQRGEAAYTLRGNTRLYRFERFLVEYPHD
jgi:glyoxylase-like metal-dependent hydrolase (beta-lactamase superfamily II)